MFDSEPAVMATTILCNKISTNNTPAYINAFEAFKSMGFITVCTQPNNFIIYVIHYLFIPLGKCNTRAWLLVTKKCFSFFNKYTEP